MGIPGDFGWTRSFVGSSDAGSSCQPGQTVAHQMKI